MQAKYRHALPQLGDKLFLTDGGIETTLIFLEGIELPHFAAFDLLRTRGRAGGAGRYYAPYVEIAKRDGRGLVLESATWRSNPDWGAKLGYSPEALDAVNAEAIDLIRAIRDAEETPASPMVLSGCIGPRGDGYAPDSFMTRGGGGGVSRAAGAGLRGGGRRHGDGDHHDLCRGGDRRRPGGEGGGDAGGDLVHGGDRRLPALGHGARGGDRGLRRGDRRLSGLLHGELRASDAFPRRAAGGGWLGRIGGMRANASKMSHAELDEAPELDAGDPEELARDYRALMRAAAEPAGARRLLRHRPPAHRRDQPCLRPCPCA